MNDRQPSPRGLTLATLTVAACAVWLLAWPYLGGRSPLHTYQAFGAAGTSPWESDFYLATALVEGTFLAWLSRRWAASWSASFDEKLRDLWARPASAYAVFAILGAALSFAVALAAIEFHPLTEDEKTYLFQAKLLLSGHLTVALPPEAAAFYQPFIVEAADGRWSGQYFWAQPALLALGQLVGLPWLIPPLEVGVAVFFSGLLAEEYSGDRRAGVLAALLAATSPLLVMTGGTLHNASLATACSAAALWGLVRLVRGSSCCAVIALGLSTGIALHNRLLDHAALLAGAGAVALYAERRSLGAFVRRLLPAIGIVAPFLALHPLINRAISGDFRRSGYYLFNDRHDWTTMGFGLGPFSHPHTPAIAATKTFTALARVAFFVTGTPFALLLPAAQVAGFVRGGGRAMAPLAPLAVYVVAYFFYAGASIYPTGPVYYDALVPLFAAWIAFGVLELHESLRDGAWRRLAAALVGAERVAALVVFFPPVLREAARTSEESARCESIVAEHHIERALVFVGPNGNGPYGTWINYPPLPSPDLGDAVLYPRVGSRRYNMAIAERFGQARPSYLVKCLGEAASITTFDPATGAARPLEPGRGQPQRDVAPDADDHPAVVPVERDGG